MLECYASGNRNVFALGFVPVKSENTVRPREGEAHAPQTGTLRSRERRAPFRSCPGHHMRNGWRSLSHCALGTHTQDDTWLLSKRRNSKMSAALFNAIDHVGRHGPHCCCTPEFAMGHGARNTRRPVMSKRTGCHSATHRYGLSHHALALPNKPFWFDVGNASIFETASKVTRSLIGPVCAFLTKCALLHREHSVTHVPWVRPAGTGGGGRRWCCWLGTRRRAARR